MPGDRRYVLASTLSWTPRACRRAWTTRRLWCGLLPTMSFVVGVAERARRRRAVPGGFAHCMEPGRHHRPEGTTVEAHAWTKRFLVQREDEEGPACRIAALWGRGLSSPDCCLAVDPVPSAAVMRPIRLQRIGDGHADTHGTVIRIRVTPLTFVRSGRGGGYAPLHRSRRSLLLGGSEDGDASGERPAARPRPATHRHGSARRAPAGRRSTPGTCRQPARRRPRREWRQERQGRGP